MTDAPDQSGAHRPSPRPRHAADPDPATTRPRRSRRTWLGVGLLVGGLVILAAAGWLAVTGMMARSELESARADLQTLRDQLGRGDLAGAKATASSLAAHAGRAHDLTTGPVWAVASTVPAGGAAIESARGIAAGVDSLASSVLPALIDAREQLGGDALQRAGGGVDLTHVTAVAPAIEHADTAVEHAERDLVALPGDTWLSSVDSARSSLLTQVDGLRSTVHSAALAARLVPPMLGDSAPQRYFVAFQNTAEARGTGGLPGTFGILLVRDGVARFERFGSDAELDGVRSGVRLATDTGDLYEAANPTGQFINSNVGPNFPDAARIWVAMWQRHTGERLDGAIALDPTALSYLLGATGPATTSGGTVVNADDVVSLTQSDVYRRFPDRDRRRAFLRDVAAAAAKRVVADTSGLSGLVRAAGRAAGERRVLVWSARPATQALLEQTSLAGAIPQTSAPYAGVSIVNQGGNKLDYYLDRTVRWQRTGCGAQRRVTAIITLHNGAPASGLPAAVTSRTDRHPKSVRPGDDRVVAYAYGTSGGELLGVRTDGVAGTARTGVDRGHPVFGVDVEIPAGATRTVVLTMVEPNAGGRAQELRQPLVRPLTMTVEDASC